MALTHTDANIPTLRINKFPSKEMFEQALSQHLIDENQISVILGDFVQADWDQPDSHKEDFIKNRTHYIDTSNTVPLQLTTWTAPDVNVVSYEEQNPGNYWTRLIHCFNFLSYEDVAKPWRLILSCISSLTIGSYTIISGTPTVRDVTGLDDIFPSGYIIPYIGNFKLYLDYMENMGVLPSTIDPDDYDTGEDYLILDLNSDEDTMGFIIMTNNSAYGLDTTPLPSINMVLNLPTVITIPLGFIPDIPLSKLYPSIPTPTPSDEGKLLSVNSDGEFELVTIVNSENTPY